jgi:putative FmdB family regulatory protein
MPLYEYECDVCGHRFEVIQKFSDAPIEKCPVCGGPVHKLQSAPAIQFKGSGWYVTDYAKRDQPKEGKTDGGPPDNASAKSSTSEKSDKGDKSEKSEKGEKSEKSASTKPGSSGDSSASSGSASSSSTSSSSGGGGSSGSGGSGSSGASTSSTPQKNS